MRLVIITDVTACLIEFKNFQIVNHVRSTPEIVQADMVAVTPQDTVCQYQKWQVLQIPFDCLYGFSYLLMMHALTQQMPLFPDKTRVIQLSARIIQYQEYLDPLQQYQLGFHFASFQQQFICFKYQKQILNSFN